MHYTSTDFDSKGQEKPRGEIWVRCPNILPSCYKLDQENLEMFTEVGWICSGDVGMIFGVEKCLKIIDRE